MVEALLASAILLMAIAAVTLPFTAGVRNQQADEQMAFASALAQELMDEILSKPYEDPQGGGLTAGPEPGEIARSQFDNMDDYHGYSEPAGGLHNALGELCTDEPARELSRSVTASYERFPEQPVTDVPACLHLTVTVSFRGQPMVCLHRLAYAVE